MRERVRLHADKPVERDVIQWWLAQHVGQTPLLGRDEEVELGQKTRNGQLGARNQMVEANLRLVVSIAKWFVGQGLDMEDLVQEGNMGLMVAADCFNPDRGCKFSTYGIHWIMQHMRRAIANQGRAIKIPVHLLELINRIYRTINEFLRDFDRELTIEEIAEILDEKPERVAFALGAPMNILSLDEKLSDNEESGTVIDFVAEKAIDPDDCVIQSERKEKINEALRVLTPRERLVIRMRFGLNGEKKRTLQEIGVILLRSKELVRQIEMKALKKLRNSPKGKHLREWLE